MNEQDPTLTNDTSTPQDEAVLDVLLTESLGGQTPPDLCDVILRRWSAEGVQPGRHPDRMVEKSVNGMSLTPSEPSNITLWLVLGTAATVLLVGSLVWRTQGSDSDLRQVSEQSLAAQVHESSKAPMTRAKPTSDPSIASSARGGGNDSPQGRTRDLRDGLQGIELAGPSDTDAPNEPLMPAIPNSEGRLASSETRQPSRDASLEEESISSVVEATRLASQMDHQWRRYWDRLGVTPTPELDRSNVAEKVKTRTGLSIRPDAFTSFESLHGVLSSRTNRQQMASVIESLITSMQVAEGDSTGLRDRIAERVTGGLDDVITQVVLRDAGSAGQQGLSVKRSQKDSHQFALALASLGMDVDMRCSRCHEPDDIGTKGAGTPSMAAYWQTFGMIEHLSRNGSNRSGPVGKPDEKLVFFDTPDGRRRAVPRGFPVTWTNGDGTAPVASEDALKESLRGSKVLSRGLVKVLASWIYGRPLWTGTFDIQTAPKDVNLDQILDGLASDLQKHEFDITRTVALLLRSPVIRRSVPESLTMRGALTASDEAVLSAMNAVDAFAAALPVAKPLARRERVAMSRRWWSNSRPTLDKPNVVLAQPTQSRDAVKPRPDTNALPMERLFRAGFPTRQNRLLPAWLDRLPDFESRSEHLAHLAGMLTLPDEIVSLSRSMREAGVSDSLVLQRVWWMIAPSV
ncbi:MAG: hypothetical protein AAGD07_16560 [Planctomycetota bacterium]